MPSRPLLDAFALYSRVTKLSHGDLKAFPGDLLGESLAPNDMRNALRCMAAHDESAYKKRLPEAAQALLTQPLAAHRRLLAKMTPEEGARQVYVMPSVPLGGGHAVALVSFAPLPERLQQSLMQQNNLMRFVVASFAAGGAAFTAAQRDRILQRSAAGRHRPTNVPRPLPPDVVKHNADLFMRDAPVLGLHLLGHNSWCEAKIHVKGQDKSLLWQSVVHITTNIHSQDGTVLWVVLRHAEFPEGLIWLSIHYGDHQVPLGDTLNSFLAPLLFHPTYQRAISLAQSYPAFERTFGKAQAAELLLNLELKRAFQRQEEARTPERARQFKLLRALDHTGGFLLASARYLRTDHG